MKVPEALIIRLIQKTRKQNYTVTQTTDKEVGPVTYNEQVFYIDLGDSMGLMGKTSKFVGDYYYDGDYITIDDYLAYVFLNLEIRK